jgi:hypothetical protein
VKSLGLGTRLLKQPLHVSNIDGTLNRSGDITHFCNLWLQRENTVIKLGFYIANLGRDRIILGHPWFKAFNPVIDWKTNQLTGPDVIIETAGFRTKAQINSILLRPPGDQSEVEKLIPPQYHRHWKVFSEEAAQRFPPSRPDNHAIKLKPGAPAKLDCKIYRQTDKELAALKQYIDESLAKGYITESKSPYASPLFFRAKVTANYAPSSTIEPSMLGQSATYIPYPSLEVLSTVFKGRHFSPRWTYAGVLITSRSKRKTVGRQLSKRPLGHTNR